jgi:hypothetical protein
MGLPKGWNLARLHDSVTQVPLGRLAEKYDIKYVLLDACVDMVPKLRQGFHDLATNKDKQVEFCGWFLELLHKYESAGLVPCVLVEGFFKYVKERHMKTAAKDVADAAAAAEDDGEPLTEAEKAQALADALQDALVPNASWTTAAKLVAIVCYLRGVPCSMCPFEADALFYHTFFVRDGIFVYFDGVTYRFVKIDAIVTKDSDAFLCSRFVVK